MKGIDLGVRLCYLLYANKITPQAIANIKHELTNASSLFYYLHHEGRDIDEILTKLAASISNDKTNRLLP